MPQVHVYIEPSLLARITRHEVYAPKTPTSIMLYAMRELYHDICTFEGDDWDNIPSEEPPKGELHLRCSTSSDEYDPEVWEALRERYGSYSIAMKFALENLAASLDRSWAEDHDEA